jgi:hypothetical protein
MTEQHPEADQTQDGLAYLNRLRAAYAGAAAERVGPGHTIPATMLEIGLLLTMLDNQAIVTSAAEAGGRMEGWNAAVTHTANTLGPTADIYRKAMIDRNPFAADAAMLLELASNPTLPERPQP